MMYIIILFFTLTILSAPLMSAYAELNLDEDLFIKQYLPTSIMFFGNSTADSLLAKLTHPDGTVTLSEIAVNKDGLFSSSFYLYKHFEVGVYSIALNDTRKHNVTFVVEDWQSIQIPDTSSQIPKQSFSDHPNYSAAKSGVITKIVDGDTLDIDGIRIRLALVDTPERGQPGYLEATDFTASLCLVGSTAYYDTDDGQRSGSYNRIIAQVYCNDQSLNEQLIIHGHANIIVDFCTVSEFATESWAVNDCTFQQNSVSDLLSGINSTDIKDALSGINIDELQETLSNIDSELLPQLNLTDYLPDDGISEIAMTDFDGQVLDNTRNDDTHIRPNPFNSKQFIFSEIHLIGIVAIVCILILAQKYRTK